MTKHLIINNTNDLLRILPCDVLCITSEGNYSNVHTVDGDKKLVLRQIGKIGELINLQLETEAEMFILVGRTIIINKDYVYTINIRKQELCMRSPLGHRVMLKPAKDALKELKDWIIKQEKEDNDEE